MNHLAAEKSPYLQQHANNPVDWYPWGEEAFSKARQENKPILLSIGYSTCHWCHVMEHESFEDQATAAVMNEFFVNIKIDREERPDIDKIYMTAVSALTGSGGWPLNVFVTPELKPFFGGTYFPPTARWGQPAWRDVIQHIGAAWKTDERQKMLDAASNIASSLKGYTSTIHTPLQGEPAWLDTAFQEFKARYDGARGGFGDAPKFPMPIYHRFLLRYYKRTGSEEALQMSTHTLRMMAHGGLYDQLGGGFSRYSTDPHWHVPHFEKMLYDNAQLAVVYADAYAATKDNFFRQVTLETLDYIRRDMTAPGGGLYSAEDADSLPSADATRKTEGAFYLWSKTEIDQLLTAEQADLFSFRYGVRAEGNVSVDPHKEFTGKNILYAAHTEAEIARERQKPESEIHALLSEAKAILFKHQLSRPRPHRDEKIITAWNGLMISGFARAYQVIGRPEDLLSAQKAALFIKDHLYDSSSQRLSRRWKDGERHGDGTADDYAFLIQGLLDLFESDFNPAWLEWAVQLTTVLIQAFYDSQHGGFYMTPTDGDPNLILRLKEDMDNVEPSASSVSVLNLIRLAQWTENSKYLHQAEQTLMSYGAAMKDTPSVASYMLTALMAFLDPPALVVVAGQKSDPKLQSLLAAVRSIFYPGLALYLLDPADKTSADFAKRLSYMPEIQGTTLPAAYACINHACRPPVTTGSDLMELLSSYSHK